jgi:hypothetical protein
MCGALVSVGSLWPYHSTFPSWESSPIRSSKIVCALSQSGYQYQENIECQLGYQNLFDNDHQLCIRVGFQ